MRSLKQRCWFLEAALCAVLCALLVVPARSEDGDRRLRELAKIRAALPVSWKIIERNAGVIPEGHYWGQKYDGVRGDELLIQGTKDVHVFWQDQTGDWHTEAVGKEALRVYLMPSDYDEGLLRFFIPKRPVSARLLFKGQELKVYAYPSMTILEKDRLKKIAENCRAIRWPDSPEHNGTLSWSNWHEDVRRMFESQPPPGSD